MTTVYWLPHSKWCHVSINPYSSRNRAPFSILFCVQFYFSIYSCCIPWKRLKFDLYCMSSVYGKFHNKVDFWFLHSALRHDSSDSRGGYCYASVLNGRCANQNSQLMTKVQCCCDSGRCWSESSVPELCPIRGSGGILISWPPGSIAISTTSCFKTKYPVFLRVCVQSFIHSFFYVTT